MSNPLKTQVTEALKFAERQARRLVEEHAGFCPAYTERGRWRRDEEAGGALLAKLAGLLAGSPVTEDADFWRGLAARLPHAAHQGAAVARRFMPNGQYLRPDTAEDMVRIESMLDVGAVFEVAAAADDGANEAGLNAHELKRRAAQHALTVQRVLCRGDGSVAEEGVFELETGAFLRQSARRGFRADSCWSRGLAASLYGFAACFGRTGDRRFLKAAEDHAEFWMLNTPEGGVPPWDFDAPMDGRLTFMQRDSSAAAVGAAGLYQLGRATHDRVRARAYEDAAMRTVETLTGPEYLASGDPAWEGILKGGVYDNRQGVGVDESVMIGDAFAVEAMVRALALL
jgi:unsaturated chondroitin disaccharide hydrolase